jgi:hypothetical protein
VFPGLLIFGNILYDCGTMFAMPWIFPELFVSLCKRHFCQYGHHPKIGMTNFRGILHHSARVRKQSFVICFEDYYTCTDTQFFIQSALENLTSVLTKALLASAP